MTNRLIYFELNTDGVGELLKGSAVQELLRAEAQSRCPSGCVVDVHVGKNRANASIGTETEEAKADNLENNTLIKTIGGG